MERLSTLARFKATCPFLARTSQASIRSLATSASKRHPAITSLTDKATACPVMGPALVQRAAILNQKASYASVADIPAACPHAAKAAANAAAAAAAVTVPQASPKTAVPGQYDYSKFYEEQLQKKHDDKSYRYFNNINRLASKFTVAHTAN